LAALFFRGATPDASVLVGLEGELKTFHIDGAFTTDRFSFRNLQQRLACGSNGKEQFRIGITTGGGISPGVIGTSKS
jgi:hypothetical protein